MAKKPTASPHAPRNVKALAMSPSRPPRLRAKDKATIFRLLKNNPERFNELGRTPEEILAKWQKFNAEHGPISLAGFLNDPHKV